MRPWYETSFKTDYLDRYPHRDEEEARLEIEAVIALIGPARDEPILDLGCGAGRHLIALCAAGYHQLAGLDLSEELLAIASLRTREAGCEGIEFTHADMRRIPYEKRFGTILSMFTTFGYFETDEQDAEVLRAAHGALRPRGSLLIDTIARTSTIAHLVPEEERQQDGEHVKIRRRLSEDGKRVEKVTRVDSIDGESIYRESVRLYTPDELRGMFQAEGFVDIRTWGSLRGEPVGPTSPRLVVAGRREAG